MADNNLGSVRVSQEIIGNWLVGKGLLNGGQKLDPDALRVLKLLGIEVSTIKVECGQEVVTIRGEANIIRGLGCFNDIKVHCKVPKDTSA